MITIKKNPETLNKLKVGTSSATPAAGEVIADKVGAGVAPAAPLHAKLAATGGTSPLEVSRLEVADEGVDLLEGMGPKQSFYVPHGTETSFEGASISAKKEDNSDTNEATQLAFSTCPDAGTNTERVIIDSTGNVKIGSSSAVDTQISVECNTTGEALGDGIRIQNARGINDDIAPMYFGVHGGTRRAKAAIGLKRTAGFGVGELRFAVDSNSDDADVSFANDTKLTIDSSGITTVGGARPLKFDPTGNFAKLTTNRDSASRYLEITDGSTVTLSELVGCQSALVLVYESTNGQGGVWFVTYAGNAELLAGTTCADTDTANKICVYKNATNHTCYLKNNLGATRNFQITQLGGILG